MSGMAVEVAGQGMMAVALQGGPGEGRRGGGRGQGMIVAVALQGGR